MYYRKQIKTKIIGITGSNGKTTSKELIYAVLKTKCLVHATKGNLNNHIGVALTLLAIRPEHEYAIIEMGANHQKEIEKLCEIAEPDYGVINNIGKAHLEGFGGEAGVKKGKGELYDFIRFHKRKLFVNGDDPLLMEMSENIERVTYGRLPSCYTYGAIIDEQAALKISLEKDTIIQTELIGNYNFSNIMLAACIGKYFGLNLEQIKRGIESYTPTNSRSQLIKKESNTIVLDAYNANPSSMKSAIENFHQAKFQNKVLILGDMFEMGEYSYAEHLAIINETQGKTFEQIIFCGPEFYQFKAAYPNCKFHLNFEHCLEAIKSESFEAHTILIKGSRGMALERLVEFIK
jgi:UDP-N-acetylmuramoyl-tripeptide--D-alanyl-D-alanine ligase